MYIKSRILSTIFRIIFIMVCGAGIVMKLMETGVTVNTVMSDFALLAGTLAVIYFIYLIVAGSGYERGVFRGAVTMYMIVVFIVYYLVYFGFSVIMPSELSPAGYLLYFVSPLMALLDYILFCRKGGFGSYSPAIWVLIPLMFNIIIFFINRSGIYTHSVSYFSFPGMNMAAAVIMLLGIGYLLFIADNIMAGRRR